MDDKLTINKEYAKKYEERKRNEELSKLQDKYGKDFQFESESSSSEEEDEHAEAWTAEKDQDFLRTLALIKAKDPRIYDTNLCFFKSDEEESEEEVKEEETQEEQSTEDGQQKKKRRKKKVAEPLPEPKAKPVYLRDYEMQQLKEHGSEAFALDSDEEDAKREKAARSMGKSYVEEEEDAKREMLLAAGRESSDSDSEGLLTLRSKDARKDEKIEADYKQWLRGEGAEIEKQAQKDLAPLKQFWNDPNLDEADRFLRDYILNDGYIDKEADEIPTYEELMAEDDEDEEEVKKQEQFETKYNFRFEEPDAEFIKSYPRTVSATSVRKVDDGRIQKRKAREERKKTEKEEREAELKRLKRLMRKEIKQKLEKVQEVTGIGVDVDNIDLDGDFDPARYDQAMQKAFGSDYYEMDEDVKPQFSDIEDDSDVGGDDGDGGSDAEAAAEPQEEGDHTTFDEWNFNSGYGVEDDGEDFNMDADFDPSTAAGKSKKQLKRERRRRKHDGPESGQLPTFNRDEKTLQQYLDEYFKLDYEDTVADTKCRFKYRKVLPNTFGLSTAEILTAEDRELNSWASLKKSVQYRTEEEEKQDLRKYRKRAREGKRKRRILATVYKPADDEEEEEVEGGGAKPVAAKKPFKPPTAKRKRKGQEADGADVMSPATADSGEIAAGSSTAMPGAKKKQRKPPRDIASSVSVERKALFGIDANKNRKRRRKGQGGKKRGTPHGDS